MEMSLDEIIKSTKMGKKKTFKSNKNIRNSKNEKNITSTGRIMKKHINNKKGSPKKANINAMKLLRGFEEHLNQQNREPTKLIISNLHADVTDLDMQELFSEFGHLHSSRIHYNKMGKSLGTADVVFQRHEDAFKAMKTYNGVPLDGCNMNISLASSSVQSSSVVNSSKVQQRLGVKKFVKSQHVTGNRGNASRKNQSKNNQGRMRAQQKGGNKNARPKNEPKKVFTREDLDAALDAYNATKN